MIANTIFSLLNRSSKKHVEPTSRAVFEQRRHNLQILTKALTSKRLTEGKEILIPCCGDGEICRLYAEHEARLVVGVEDHSELRALRKVLERENPTLPLLFLDESPTNLPYPDESFDTIILDGVLEYQSDPNAVLRESFRLLRRGGILCVSILPAYAPHACGTDLITLPYATLLFPEKARTAYVADWCKKRKYDLTAQHALLYTDAHGVRHLRTESRLRISQLRTLLSQFSDARVIKRISIPLAKGCKPFTHISGINEICTRRYLAVIEKQLDEHSKRSAT